MGRETVLATSNCCGLLPVDDTLYKWRSSKYWSSSEVREAGSAWSRIFHIAILLSNIKTSIVGPSSLSYFLTNERSSACLSYIKMASVIDNLIDGYHDVMTNKSGKIQLGTCKTLSLSVLSETSSFHLLSRIL